MNSYCSSGTKGIKKRNKASKPYQNSNGEVLRQISHSMGDPRDQMPGAIPNGPMPVQMAPSPRPSFSRCNVIKKPDCSANAASAISTSVRSRDLHQVGYSLADVAEVTD
ncbi:hypothetical protein AMTR_s00207p00032440 [Amborella trichopoda]|uniref:Uncharacterized protein n=1 Tax=Amborella trichopoda TaxID=13333 RepID=W1P5Y1_AMBTC|nr:hypothetical protein AMTR_s00207p00032440 [Amborella trichopoda]